MVDRLDRLNTFLCEVAASQDFEASFAALCGQLVGEGLPLWRVTISYRTLDPTIRAQTLVWWRDKGSTPDRFQTTHGDGEAQYLRSPIHHLLERDARTGRWRLQCDAIEDFPLLVELRAAGGTDYVLHLLRFDAAMPELPGVAIAFATDRADGFSDAELAELARIAPALGLAAGRAMLVQIMTSVLGLYLGARTARLVLDGQIRRGLGQRIEAAILLADLRGFTLLAASADPLRLVAWLDEHLAAMIDAVSAQGGEVLKLLGDGLLAVFPVEGTGADAEAAACRRALCGAEAAQAANGALLDRRRAAGEPGLGLDVALHFGEVVYGNVGSPHRLDFTVVGPAVNEASRIEGLCATLDRSLLLSDAFARRCGRPTVSLGRHALRGVPRPCEIHALASGAPAS